MPVTRSPWGHCQHHARNEKESEQHAGTHIGRVIDGMTMSGVGTTIKQTNDDTKRLEVRVADDDLSQENGVVAMASTQQSMMAKQG